MFQLATPKSDHFTLMQGWFPDKAATLSWGGPGFRFPFSSASFVEDLHLESLDSYVLLRDGDLMAFGQFYKRLGRCHLGRLAVNPGQRGQGIVNHLIRELVAVGCPKLSASECSLFVLERNTAAIRAYEKAGFVITDYPGVIPIDDCLYMVKPVVL